jgi:cytosine/adenosine deaminase-related metal-dependent hydrolase
MIDPFEEARGLEMNERLATGRRGLFSVEGLVDSLTINGHRSLGWDEGGSIAVGSTCDLVGVRLDSERTAGADPVAAVLAATATDVHTVIVGGAPVVVDGEHRLGDVGRMLTEALSALRN